MGQGEVAESINVKATAAKVWPMISDPANYGRWSPEVTGVKRRTGSGTWQVGDRFVGANKVWLPWSTSCTVVVAEPDQGEFAFDVDFAGVPIARWSYTVADTGDGSCLVTETWTDRRTGIIGALAKPSGVFIGRGLNAAVRNRHTMRATLLALKAEAESHA